MSTLATFIQHSFGSPSQGNQRRKRNKRNPNWKRRIKIVTVDDMILYIENPKDAIRKMPELINKFSKFVGFKINTEKSVALPYTNNKDQKENLRTQTRLPSHQKG